MEKKKFSNPDEIPFSYKGSLFLNTLRSETFIQSRSWTRKIYENIKDTPVVLNAKEEFGEVCAELLIKKELFNSLKIIAKKYLGIKIYNKLYPDNQKKYPILIEEFDFYVLLKKNIPELDDLIKFKITRNTVTRLLKEFFIPILNLKAIKILEKIPFKDNSREKRIGCEVVEGLDLNMSRSELNWWDEVSPSPDNFIFFIRRELSKESLKNLKRYVDSGAKFFVDRDFEGNAQQFIDNGIKLLIPKISTSFAWPSFDSMFWPRKRIKTWKLALKWWELFFKKFNINIWISPIEESNHSILQRAALERLQGFLIHRQRSVYYVEAQSYCFNPAHINFTWNEFQTKHLVDNECHSKKYLTVGHSFGVSPSWERNIDSVISKFLNEKEDFFKIVVFDNRCGLDAPMTTEQMKAFYDKLFDWVIRNKKTALFVKSKKKKTFTKNLVSENLLSKLEKEERLFILNNLGSILPITVSRSMDLTIGVNISSAAFEANIAGKRALHYYPGIDYYHPLAKNGLNKILFNEVPKIINAVESIHKDNDSHYGILKEDSVFVDEFCDGNGPKRISKVINYLFNRDETSRDLDDIENLDLR